MKATIERAYTQYLKDIEAIIGTDVTMSNDLEVLGSTLFGQRFRGVFAHNKIPALSASDLCIANLDDDHEEGTHWVGIAGDLCYDSFARTGIGFDNYKQTERDVEQRVHENNCGARSMAFLCIVFVYGKKASYYV